MSRPFFEAVADALAGFLPRELRGFSSQASSRNLKVWFAGSWREHYEVQLVSPQALPAKLKAGGPALEIGFHSEHPDPERSMQTVDALMASERTWRKEIGTGAEAGPFLGSDRWARLSELWRGDDVTDDAAAIEAAEQLAAYITALEPLRSRLGTVSVT